MKKNSLAILALSFLMSLGTIACSSGNEASSSTDSTFIESSTGTSSEVIPEIEDPVEPEVSIAKTQPLNYIQQNLMEEKGDEKEPTPVTFIGNHLDGDYQVLERHPRFGFAIVKNKAGNVGAFSYTHNKFIMACQYYKDWVRYEVIEDDNLAFIKFDYENKSIISDNYGNLFYNDEQVYSFYFQSEVIYGHYYLTMNIAGETTNYCYEGGKATAIDVIPDRDDLKPEEEDYPFKPNFNVGDLFIDNMHIDLSLIGQDGYILLGSSSGIVSVFDKESKEEVVTFAIPLNIEPNIVGQYIFYQRVNDLPDDSENYDFIRNTHKAMLDTYQIDIMTGETSKIEFDYLVNNILPYKDENGKYTLALIDAQKIDDRHILEDEVTLLVNDKKELLNDVTNYAIESYIKVKDNYFNLETEILYDANLKPISYLGNMDPIYLPKKELFVGDIHGYKGMIDTNGKVVIPFDYDDIYYDDNYDYALLNKDRTYTMYNYADTSKNVTYKKQDIIHLNSEAKLFALKGKDDVKIFTLNGLVNQYKPELLEDEVLSVLNFNTNYSEYDQVSTSITFGHGDVMETYFYRIGKEHYFNSVGVANDVKPQTGHNFEDAIDIKVGSNMVHSNIQGYTYFQFTAKETGLYNFDAHVSYAHVLDEYVDEETSEVIDEYPTIYQFNNMADTYFLTAGEIYYFEINFEGYQSITLTQLAKSSKFVEGDEKTPLNTMFIREITPTADGMYKINYSDAFSVYRFDELGREHSVNRKESLDDGVLYEFKANTTYIALFSEVVSEEENPVQPVLNFKLYNIESMKEFSKAESVTYTEASSRAYLRKFTPKAAGEYFIKTNAPVIYYRYDEIQKGNLNANIPTKSYVDFSIIKLEKDITYIFYINANNNSLKEFTFDIVLGSFDGLTNMELDTSYFVNDGLKDLHRFTCYQTGYYWLTGADPDNDSLTVFEYNPTDNTHKMVNGQIANSKFTYKLEQGKKYVVLAQATDYSGFHYQLTRATLDKIGETDDSKTFYPTHDNANYHKFSPKADAYYGLQRTSYVDATIYVVDPSKENGISPLDFSGYAQGEKVYHMTPDHTYIIKAACRNDTYQCYMRETTKNSNEVKIYNLEDSYYFSRNSTTEYTSQNTSYSTSADANLNFRMAKDCNFSFDYDIESVSNYGWITVYHNSNRVVVPVSSGSYKAQNVSIDAKAGDLIQIMFNRNSCSNYYTNRVRIYNIKATPVTDLVLTVTNIPADKAAAGDVYAWAFGDQCPGAFYKGVYDSGSNTYRFYVPKECTKFVVATMKKNEKPDWNNKIAQTEDIVIGADIPSYSCGNNWKAN